MRLLIYMECYSLTYIPMRDYKHDEYEGLEEFITNNVVSLNWDTPSGIGNSGFEGR